MARLASQSQGGFYATPPSEMALVVGRLWSDPEAEINLLDPCAGEGAALKQLADRLQRLGSCPKTYGVELEKERAATASQILDQVVKGGYEWLRASREVFSGLWLNPPYDQEAEQQGRTEVRFLRNLTEPQKCLQPGGLFLFCVPQHVLTPAAALLAHRMENIKVYRFTDANYPRFQQVVLFGYRRALGQRVETKEVRQWLEALGQSGPEALPPLDEPDGVTFDLPAGRGPVELFRGSVLDPEEIMKDVEASSAWEAMERLLVPPFLKKGNVKMRNPILPLKPTHYAVAIAAGAVGGNMGTHILEGLTKKAIDRQEVEGEEDGKHKIIETERHVTTIRVFSPKGVFNLE